MKNVSTDPNLHVFLQAKVQSDLRFYRAFLARVSVADVGEDLHTYVVRYFFALLTKAQISTSRMAHNAFTQHWVPLTFTKKFSEKVSASRICYLREVGKVAGELEEKLVDDKRWRHPPLKSPRRGYMESSAEEFLAYCEGEYGKVLHTFKNAHHVISALDYVVLYLFVTLLEVRKPKDASHEEFSFRTLEELLLEVLKELDSFPTPFLRVMFTSYRLPINPETPVRNLVTRDGVRTRVWPVSSQVALVVSDSAIPRGEATRLVAKYQDHLRWKLACGHISLYGVRKLDLDI